VDIDLQSVPTLDEVAAAPSKVRGLSGPALAALAVKAATVQGAIAGAQAERLLTAGAEQAAPEQVCHEPAPLLTAQQVAERLALTPGQIYELARAGKLKSSRHGKYVRFSESDVTEYLAAATRNRAKNELSSSRSRPTVRRKA